jgi:hypothetical protein
VPWAEANVVNVERVVNVENVVMASMTMRRLLFIRCLLSSAGFATEPRCDSIQHFCIEGQAMVRLAALASRERARREFLLERFVTRPEWPE